MVGGTFQSNMQFDLFPFNRVLWNGYYKQNIYSEAHNTHGKWVNSEEELVYSFPLPQTLPSHCAPAPGPVNPSENQQ